jgi:integrase
VPVEVIHAGTRVALREAWVQQGQPAAGLVVVDASGEPVHPDTYSRRFRALSAAAGVPDLGSIHNVRHTVATALHDNGVEPRKAASLLGHKVTTHLAYYVPTTDSGANEAAAVAGGLFTTTQ